MSDQFTLHEGGADSAEAASYVIERQNSAQIAAQRFLPVLWTVRLRSGDFLHPDEPMTLCDLFDHLEEKLHINPAVELETAAYFDESHDTVVVVRPRGGNCDEALREEVLSHRVPS